MRTKLLGFLKLYEEEVSLLLWTAVLLFIIRSSGIILNNYAETTFLKRYGVEYLPIVNMLNAVATFFITGFLTAFMGKLSSAKLLSYLFIFCGISVTLIRILIPSGIELLYPILFMLKSQFELLQAMLFWNICNDLFNTRQSKRIFPLLTAGGVIGLILGSLGTPYFARLFQMDNLLYLYLCTTLSGAAIVQAMGRSYPSLIFSEKKGHQTKKKVSMAQEFKNVLPLIKDSVLIKIVLVLTFMPNVVIPIMNYQFNYAVNDQFASEAGMIQFFGYFRAVLYGISLFILLFVGRIYGKWGLPVALMFHPFNYMIAFFGFLFQFNFISAMYARMSTNILRTTINMPSINILYGLFPESYRGMIRPFLRGTVVRLALFVGSSLILISGNYFHPKYLSLVALPFVLAWMAAPVFLKSKYPKILMDLISNNLLDIKSMEKNELVQVFKGDKILSELEQAFLAARGKEVIWYGKLLKIFSEQALDNNILKVLKNQDDKTQIALIKMISPKGHETSIKPLMAFIDPERPEVTIAILKILSQLKATSIKGIDLSAYVDNPDPVVRGFATACLYPENPGRYGALIDKWINSEVLKERQSGIVSAGLRGKREYIDTLLKILSVPDIDPVIPDIIIALSRLGARELNAVIYSYLSYDDKNIKMAALDALDINDDFSLKKAIQLIADNSRAIHEFAKQKIKDSDYQNNSILVESLSLPGTRIRRGLFELLETLDIKELDIFLFARKNLDKCYACLAMSQNLKAQPGTGMRDLAVEHLIQQKELCLENIIRVLAIRDQTGRMKTAWRGIFSPDSKQKANAIELLSDIMDRKLLTTMLPLLESPTPAMALTEGEKVTRIPRFDPEGRQVLSNLLSSEDWVDIVMGLGLTRVNPSLIEDKIDDLLEKLESSINTNILKEVQMVRTKDNQTSKNPQRIKSTQISIGEKILLLKDIEIFSGLSPAELAAIAGVTKELNYPEDRTVIRQNDVGETVFLVIDGEVEVIKELMDGNEMVLDTIKKGDAFGEMALIENEPRSATIRTTKKSRFLILHQQEFKETAMEFPRIALKICKVLSSRIRHLHGRIQDNNL